MASVTRKVNDWMPGEDTRTVDVVVPFQVMQDLISAAVEGWGGGKIITIQARVTVSVHYVPDLDLADPPEHGTEGR